MKEQGALSARTRKNWDLWLFFLLLAALAVMLFHKCRYGFANIDEAFYLTIPKRLIQGDQLMLHEWHLSQLSGFLLAPILRLYLLPAGTTEGMLLAFRRIYTLVQLLAAVAVYFVLRPSSKPGALIGALLWCVYAPFGIMALSYNSMGILFVTLSILLHFRCEKPGLLILSGALFACAVLCCPFLCLVWGAYALQALLWPRLRRATWRPDVRKFAFLTLGIAGMAAVFLFFLFRRLSPGRLLEILPLVLKDSEHRFAPVYKFRTFMAFLFLCGRYGGGIVLGYCVLTLAGLLCKRSEGKTLCVTGVFLLCAFHLWAMIQTYGYFNYLMPPPVLCGLRLLFDPARGNAETDLLRAPAALPAVCSLPAAVLQSAGLCHVVRLCRRAPGGRGDAGMLGEGGAAAWSASRRRGRAGGPAPVPGRRATALSLELDFLGGQT